MLKWYLMICITMNNTDLISFAKIQIIPHSQPYISPHYYLHREERERKVKKRERDIKILVNRFLIFDIFSSTQLCVLYNLVGNISNINK